MTLKCLVAAPDEKTARKLGNAAAPVPVLNLKNDIKCDLLLLLCYDGSAPQVICILMTILLSNCCNADVKVEGRTTQHYVCVKCKKACDAKPKQRKKAVCTCYDPGRITDLNCPVH